MRGTISVAVFLFVAITLVLAKREIGGIKEEESRLDPADPINHRQPDLSETETPLQI